MRTPISFALRHSYILLIVITGIIIFEFLLFNSYVNREIIGFYPKNMDQQYYLLFAYTIYEKICHEGLLTGLYHTPIQATGIFFPIQAAIFFLLTGASRYNALLLNFIYFITLQLTVFFVAKSLFKKKFIAFLLLGLVLATHTTFLGAGDIVDFRMDFIAFCLYGIFVSLSLKSNIFLENKWSWLATLTACLLVQMRFLTVVYILIIATLLFAYLIISKRVNRNFTIKIQHIQKRIKNLLKFGGCVILSTLPYLYLARYQLYQYYIVGHFTGPEKNIRAGVAGISFLKDLLFYPHILLTLHLSPIIVCLSGILFVLAIWMKISNSKARLISSNLSVDFKVCFIFLALSFFVPLAILTLDLAKSFVVIGIIVVPFLWMMVTIFMVYYDEVRFKKTNHLLLAISIITLIFGLHYQWMFYKNHASKTTINELYNITQTYIKLGDYALEKKWIPIHFSFNYINDSMTNLDLAVLFYEIKHRMLTTDVGPFGNKIYTTNESEIEKSLALSNVVILSDDPSMAYRGYPFDNSSYQLRYYVEKQVTKQFKKFESYTYNHVNYTIYVR